MTAIRPTEKPPESPVMYDCLDQFSIFLSGEGVNMEGFKGTVGSLFSCGITMLSGLYGLNPSQIVNKVLKERHPKDRKKIKEAFVIFSDTDYNAKWGGNALYRYIKENNLGNIAEFGPRMNPNTGNMIKIWVWEPPHDSLSPKDKYLPVYGKIMTINPPNIGGVTYTDDPRFLETRGTRGG